MYAELSVLYINYMKYLFNFKLKNKILNIRMTEVSAKSKSFSVGELFQTYESFDALITQIFSLFEHQSFCKRSRLYCNVIFMLFADLIQIYKAFYVIVTEVLERFPDLTLDQSKKAFVIYQNFVDLTTIMKSKADKIMIEFQFNLQLPQYYVPDAGLVDTLKYCIENKQSNP